MPISLLLQILPVLINEIGPLYELVSKIHDALKQSGELTPEQEAELDKHIADLESQPWWQPDA